jgi:hypothetical protein
VRPSIALITMRAVVLVEEGVDVSLPIFEPSFG